MCGSAGARARGLQLGRAIAIAVSIGDRPPTVLGGVARFAEWDGRPPSPGAARARRRGPPGLLRQCRRGEFASSESRDSRRLAETAFNFDFAVQFAEPMVSRVHNGCPVRTGPGPRPPSPELSPTAIDRSPADVTYRRELCRRLARPKPNLPWKPLRVARLRLTRMRHMLVPDYRYRR
jgi:hypothetical protein